MSISRPSPNAALVGQPGSRLLLDTPALVLDLDAFERNLRTVHDRAKERGAPFGRMPNRTNRQPSAGPSCGGRHRALLRWPARPKRWPRPASTGS